MYRFLLLSAISLITVLTFGQEEHFIGSWAHSGSHQIHHFKIKKSHEVIWQNGDYSDRDMDITSKGAWKIQHDTLILILEEGEFSYCLKDGTLYSTSANYITLEKTSTNFNGLLKQHRKEPKFVSDQVPTIQTGIYRRYKQEGDSAWYLDLKICPDRTFSFHDTRIESCFFWSLYEGDWKVDGDTLTLVWEQNLQLFQRQFIVSEKKITYIEPTETNKYLNWGDFSFFTSELREDLE